LGLGAVFALLLTCCGGIGALVYYTPGGVRDSAERANSTNNLKQIGLAIHNYHSVTNKLPPPYLKTKTGQPGLSWRVAILPYVEQDYLYKQFKLDETWDSPTNRALLNQMPKTYKIASQTDATVTHYRVFAGPGTMFDPTIPYLTFARIPDGTSNTIAVVEANDPVPWTKPDELPFPPKGAIAPLLNWRKDKALILMGDGFVRPLSQTVSEKNLRNAITVADGMVVDLP
jgi:hypothetical protein